MGGKYEGLRGVFNDIKLLLGDLLGLGNLKPEQELTVEVLFGLLGYLAKTDRLVTSHESDLANAVMDELDLSIAGRKLASEAFHRGMTRNINIDAELLRYTDTFKAGSVEVDRLYDVLLRLAVADNRLNPREHQALADITKGLGLPAEMLDARLALHAKA